MGRVLGRKASAKLIFESCLSPSLAAGAVTAAKDTPGRGPGDTSQVQLTLSEVWVEFCVPDLPLVSVGASGHGLWAQNHQ